MLPSHLVMGSVIANEIQRGKQAGSSVDGHFASLVPTSLTPL